MGRRKKGEPVRAVRPPPVAVAPPLVQQGLSNARIKVVPVPPPPLTPAPNTSTRRSLRQQERKATKPNWLLEEEYEEHDSEDMYVPTPPPAKRRFLKAAAPPAPTAKFGKRHVPSEESTATVLNRLIGHRVGVKSRGRLPAKAASSSRGMRTAAARKQMTQTLGNNYIQPAKFDPSLTPSAKASVSQSNVVAHGTVQKGRKIILPVRSLQTNLNESEVNPSQLKKRGRKRKEEVQVQMASIKSEVQGQTSSQSLPPRKKGRQGAATESVKPRFPFCSICLSKQAPSEYVIDYMSCPNEYQRMRRLFVYIYKDLKFPFLPFDLERENVFDYCDLPLCDCCIALYRDIYDTYAQIENTRDELKSKIERLVYQIQLSEKNPAVAAQLTSIKNSPDPLMNKYCNFRRRFSTYKPGDSRQSEGSSLVPATIARIRVINPTPKRTTSSQTIMTSAHFPPPQPQPQQSQTNQGASGSATARQASPEKSKPEPVSTSAPLTITTAAIKTEVDTTGDHPDNSTPKNVPEIAPKVLVAPTPTPSAKEPKPQQINKPSKPTTATTTTPVVKNGISTPASSSKPATTVKTGAAFQVSAQQVQSTRGLSSTSTKPSTSERHSSSKLRDSVVTFLRKPGNMGQTIIRSSPQASKVMPTDIFGRPSSSSTTPGAGADTCQRETGKSGSATHKGTELTSLVQVKDEPQEMDPGGEEEADPFLNGDTEKSSPSSSLANSDNVFHKHKKLRILPLPVYKENSSDSCDSASAKDNVDGDGNAQKPVEKDQMEAVDLDKSEEPEADEANRKDQESEES